MKILLTNTESETEGVVGSIGRVTSQANVVFLSTAEKYPANSLKITENLQYVVIFVPYGKDYLSYRANAKVLRNQFFGTDIFIVDTDQTYKTSVNCRLEYDQVPTTLALTIDYLLDQKKSIKVGPDMQLDDFYNSKLITAENAMNI